MPATLKSRSFVLPPLSNGLYQLVCQSGFHMRLYPKLIYSQGLFQNAHGTPSFLARMSAA